jgi:hypothetical protein
VIFFFLIINKQKNNATLRIHFIPVNVRGILEHSYYVILASLVVKKNSKNLHIRLAKIAKNLLKIHHVSRCKISVKNNILQKKI